MLCPFSLVLLVFLFSVRFVCSPTQHYCVSLSYSDFVFVCVSQRYTFRTFSHGHRFSPVFIKSETDQQKQTIKNVFYERNPTKCIQIMMRNDAFFRLCPINGSMLISMVRKNSDYLVRTEAQAGDIKTGFRPFHLGLQHIGRPTV